jgi:hypothetical protein
LPADPPGEAGPNLLGTGTGVSSDSGLGTVRLGEEADRVVGSVDEQVKLGDYNLRKWMAIRIVWVFIGGNIVTLVGLGVLVWLDQMNIERKLVTPGDRIVDRQVIMTLLAATAVQVGAITVIVARYLFPGRSVE